MKKTMKVLCLASVLAVLAGLFCGTFVSAQAAVTTIETNESATISDKWVGAVDGSVTLALDKSNKLYSGQSVKASVDTAKNEYRVATIRYDYMTNVAGSAGICLSACADQPTTVRVAVIMDWSKQRYVDIKVDTTPRKYTINWADSADYGLPFAVTGAGHFTQLIFQIGREGGDPTVNNLYLDELQYYTGTATTDLNGSVITPSDPQEEPVEEPQGQEDVGTATQTVMTDNEAAVIDEKWVGSADGSATVTLDATDKLGTGKSAKLAIDCAKNQYAVATIRYDYMTNVAGSDGLRLIACADKDTTVRVAVIMDWTKQRYADLQLTTQPRTYTLRWEDCATYPDAPGFDVKGAGHFTQVIFQIGRAETDPKVNTLYVDELAYFTGTMKTNLIGSVSKKDEPQEDQPTEDQPAEEPEKVYTKDTVICDNGGKELDELWGPPMDGSVVITPDKTNKLGKGGSAKFDYDRSKNEYDIATVQYNYQQVIPGSDGIKFLACADQPMTMRVAIVMDWNKQRYYDIQVGPEAKEYIIYWKDCATYPEAPGFDVKGAGNLTSVVFQVGRVAEDPQKATFWLDELAYFSVTDGPSDSPKTGDTAIVVPALVLLASALMLGWAARKKTVTI